MYIYLKIDNICGIDQEIKIDFLAEPRKRTKKETVVEIEQGKNLNKITGILGCNASGKSSIIKAITAVDYFLTYNSEKNENDEKERFYFRKIESILPKANVNRKDEYSVIEVCTYINNCDRPGIYTYRLEYTLNPLKEIKMIEKLTYKNNFNGKEKEILNISKKKLESEIGIKYNYRESFIEEIKDNEDFINSNFMDKLIYYQCFYEYIYKQLIYAEDKFDNIRFQHSIIQKWIEQDIKTIENVVKLIDRTIYSFELEIIEGTQQKRINYYNENKEKLNFVDMSSGTRKFLTYIYLILVTLNYDGTILIDEIENSLHNDLVKFILKLITLKDSKSQIIFTTNNQYTMDEEIMRIDQMYYLEKNNEGKTELKRFSESLRNEKNSNQVRSDETIRLKFKEKSICKGFQPSMKKIDEFVEYVNDKDILSKHVLE